jgi:hypothetical protein
MSRAVATGDNHQRMESAQDRLRAAVRLALRRVDARSSLPTWSTPRANVVRTAACPRPSTLGLLDGVRSLRFAALM